MRVRSVVALVSIVLLLSGCIGAIDPGPRSARARNATDVRLEIYLVRSTPILLATVDPGVEVELDIAFGPGGCNDRALVARTLEGLEVDRRPGATCDGDLWIVDGDPDS